MRKRDPTTTFNAGDEEVAFDREISTGALAYENDINGSSSLVFASTTRSNHLSIDGETLGLGLNLGPADCTFAGTATAIRFSVGNND